MCTLSKDLAFSACSGLVFSGSGVAVGPDRTTDDGRSPERSNPEGPRLGSARLPFVLILITSNLLLFLLVRHLLLEAMHLFLIAS